MFFKASLVSAKFSRGVVLALGTACLAAAVPAQAERPMVVDDAGTLDKGGAKVEFGWSRDDKARGFDAAVGYGPIENLEVEINLAEVRDRSFDPTVRVRALGAALKWVPLQAENGLSMGVKLEHARARADARHSDSETAYGDAVTGLATWGFATGPRVHVNLGREWVRAGGDTEVANTWGVGAEHPLTASLAVAAEVFGAEDARPDRQIGLRYEIIDGLKLSAGVGRGNDRSFATVGLAWEF